MDLELLGLYKFKLHLLFNAVGNLLPLFRPSNAIKVRKMQLNFQEEISVEIVRFYTKFSSEENDVIDFYLFFAVSDQECLRLKHMVIVLNLAWHQVMMVVVWGCAACLPHCFCILFKLDLGDERTIGLSIYFGLLFLAGYLPFTIQLAL